MKLKRVFQITLFLTVYAFLIFLVYLWVREPGSTLAMKKLNSNYQKWQTSKIEHYRFSLKIGCFCGFYSDMPVIVEVTNNSVVSVIDNKGKVVSLSENPDGTYNEYAYYADLFTLEGIFAYAKNALEKADGVHIEYDKDFGYPKRIGIDWREEEVDDEIGFTVTNFEVIP